jgi:hypothetical protein
MHECPQCHSQFEQRTPQHNFCGYECWLAAGGKHLRDVSDLTDRRCIRCEQTFPPTNRLQRYCTINCHHAAGEERMQRYLMAYIDDVGRIAATKEKCLEVALSQGHSPKMFAWWWAERHYMLVDDRLRLEDLPSA